MTEKVIKHPAAASIAAILDNISHDLRKMRESKGNSRELRYDRIGDLLIVDMPGQKNTHVASKKKK